jgi:peptidoglycan/xylan/chitin deacetylase (PgdA/CDA1 family)
MKRTTALAPPTLVVMYHRIAHDPPDPQGLQVRPEHFEAQLRWLRDRADIEPIGCLAKPPGPRPRVVVTLDDGYVDNLTTAKPILEKLGVPATVFVTSGLLGSPDGFWQDQLIDLLLRHNDTPQHFEIELGGRPLRAHIGSRLSRQRAHTFLHRRFRREAPATIENAMGQLIEHLGIRPQVPSSALPLARQDLRNLTRGGLVTVGAHTVHHAMLASLDEPDQAYEIRQSAADLAEILGEPITSFAYPFGRSDEYDSTSVRIVSEAFDRAFTAGTGVVSDGCNPFELPRIYVGDWDTRVLSGQLAPYLA